MTPKAIALNHLVATMVAELTEERVSRVAIAVIAVAIATVSVETAFNVETVFNGTIAVVIRTTATLSDHLAAVLAIVRTRVASLVVEMRTLHAVRVMSTLVAFVVRTVHATHGTRVVLMTHVRVVRMAVATVRTVLMAVVTVRTVRTDVVTVRTADSGTLSHAGFARMMRRCAEAATPEIAGVVVRATVGTITPGTVETISLESGEKAIQGTGQKANLGVVRMASRDTVSLVGQTSSETHSLVTAVKVTRETVDTVSRATTNTVTEVVAANVNLGTGESLMLANVVMANVVMGNVATDKVATARTIAISSEGPTAVLRAGLRVDIREPRSVENAVIAANVATAVSGEHNARAVSFGATLTGSEGVAPVVLAAVTGAAAIGSSRKQSGCSMSSGL